MKKWKYRESIEVFSIIVLGVIIIISIFGYSYSNRICESGDNGILEYSFQCGDWYAK